MIDLGVQIDMSEMNKLLPQYLLNTSKSTGEALNDKMFMIMIGAWRTTDKADPKRIKQYLEQTDEEGRKLIYRIINAKRKLKGETPIYGSEMTQESRKFLNRALNSIRFLASGWLPGLRKIFPFTAMKSKTIANKRGKDKGGVIPSKKTGTNLFAEAWNSVFGSNPAPIVEQKKIAGLQKGFDLEVRSIAQYLEKKHQKEAANIFNK